jgi:hypothetical protein
MTPTVAFVGGLKIGDVAKHAVFESLCQLGEEAFEGVKPGARVIREMKRPARVASEPRTFSCLWVIRQLENAPAMRRQQMIAPDFLHRGDRKPAAFRDGLSSPIGGFMRRRFQGQRNHPLNARAQLVRRRAAGFCRGEARPRLREKALLPTPDARLGLACHSHDSACAKTIRSQKNDTAPLKRAFEGRSCP